MLIAILAAAATAQAPSVVAANAAPTVEIVRPKLVARPDTELVYKAYPPKAAAEQKDGSAVLHCRVTLAGSLADCTADQDTPSGYGFAEAALGLSTAFKMTPQTEGGKPVDTGKVNFRMRFEAKPSAPVLLQQATLDDLQAVWPAAAMKKGAGGFASLRCEVTVTGALQFCVVDEESPAGMGFGNAAKALAPQFLLKPAQLRGEPVPFQDFKLKVRWEGETPMSTGSLIPQTSQVFAMAPWLSVPTREDMAIAYPAAAAAKKLSGKVSLRCMIRKNGGVIGCETGAENPKSMGFKKAAMALVPKFQVDVATAPKKMLSAYIDLAFDFDPSVLETSDAVKKPTITAYEVFSAPKPAEFAAAFPKPALAAGVKSGEATLTCDVGEAGRLEHCATTSETPTALGFGDAAIGLGNQVRVNAWTRAGQPLIGAKLVLPIRLVAP